jgi:hypothetical protein
VAKFHKPEVTKSKPIAVADHGCLLGYVAPGVAKFHNPEVTKSKPIAVADHGCLWCYETSRIPNFVDIQLTDGGEVTLYAPAVLYGRENSQ